MAKNQETINNKLENFLRAPERRYNPAPLDSSGNPVVGTEAEAFQFDFIKDDTNYGPVTVTLDGLNQVIVYFGDKVKRSPKQPLDGSESWFDFIKALSYWAFTNGLTFDLEDDSNLGSDMAKRAHKQKMNEGYYAMGKNKSYSDNVPATKMIIQHTRNIEEGEQRYRNVEKIFVENANGERFLLPTNKPGLGRVYARHIAEGGTPYDERGKHITSIVEEYNKMAGFVRATRNGQFNESAQRLVTEGINHYQKLRETLHKMAGKKGYNTYFESWTPSLMENEEQVDVSEMFMTSSLDPRIESVMPILGKLSKNITEDKLDEADMFEEWAESIANEGIGPEQKAVGQLGPTEKITKDNPTRGKLVGASESVEQDVAEGDMYGDEEVSWEKGGRRAPTGAFRNPAVVKTNKPIGTKVSDIGPGGKEYNVKTDQEWDKQKGVAEGTYNKDVERAFPDGKARGVKTGASAPKGTSTMPKDKEKAKGKPVAEGQEDLEAILRIIKK